MTHRIWRWVAIINNDTLKLGSTWQQRRSVFSAAVPIMLANITVPLVGVVDTAVMGRMSDPVYIGATAIGATIFSSIFWLFGFLRMGTGGLVAQAVGRHDTAQTQQTLYRAMILSLLIGIVLIAFQQPIVSVSLKAFVASKELRQLTQQYFFIRIFSAPATLMLYVVIGTLIGLQKMRTVLVLQLILNSTNIALNIFFFMVMQWGIQGVALATVISEYLALAVGLVLIFKQIPVSVATFWNPKLLDRTELKNLLSINANLFIRTLCLIASYYWLTIASARLGEIPLAANTILIQLLHVMAYALDGFSHTAESLGGQAYGRRNKTQFVSAIRVCAELGLLFALLFSAAYAVFGHWLIHLMTSISDVSAYADHYLVWVAIAPVISVASFLFDGIFIGVTHTREMRNGMIISLLIFMLASITLLTLFGNHGLWASYILLMICRGLTLAAWYPGILRQFDPDSASSDIASHAN